MVQWVKNLTTVAQVAVEVQWVKDLELPVSCGLGHRHSLDLELLWFRHRPAATVPTGPLAWELP